MGGVRKNLVGEQFGDLTVRSYARSRPTSSGKGTVVIWNCECACGKKKEVSSPMLRTGKARSCGCKQYKRKYGMTGQNFPSGQSLEYGLWARAKLRAAQKKLDFDLTPFDILVPDVCPLLGIPLKKGVGPLADNSPSLDRIKLNAGYVRGNVWVTSYKANSIKRNATLQELQTLTKNLEIRLGQ